MVAKTQDFSKMMQDVAAAWPVDTAALQDAFRTSAAMGEKFSRVALEAAEKSAEISNRFARTTIAKLGDVSKVKADPADYSKSVADFASAQAETLAETMAAFAEVAKKAQIDTVEVVLAAGKDLTEDASAAVKKATTEISAAARKATAPAN